MVKYPFLQNALKIYKQELKYGTRASLKRKLLGAFRALLYSKYIDRYGIYTKNNLWRLRDGRLALIYEPKFLQRDWLLTCTFENNFSAFRDFSLEAAIAGKIWLLPARAYCPQILICAKHGLDINKNSGIAPGFLNSVMRAGLIIVSQVSIYS